MPRTQGRNRLAFIGGFVQPREDAAHGTLHASYLACREIAAVGGYDELHVYQESAAELASLGTLVLPPAPPTRVLPKAQLAEARGRYATICVANGEQIKTCPFVLRPPDDWVPIVCSVGTTHIAGQWSNLLIALGTGALRAHDGFIFKSAAARRLFREVWASWRERFNLALPPPELDEVIPNGVDVEANKRDDNLRHFTRRSLQVRDGDVVFLGFSRLSPGTKGDQLALVVRWRQVLARLPNAVLVLAGQVVDRGYVAELRATARTAGVADRVIVVDNPAELFAQPRQSLMSAADVFVHLSTGVEEASPLVIQEAMAHGLPVIASDWAGARDSVTEGENGHLIETRALPAGDPHRRTQFGHLESIHAIAAARAVACDFTGFVACAAGLGDGERRARMGANARKVAEDGCLPRMAARYVWFFDRVAAQAKRNFVADGAHRPLVDADQVLGAQAARRLHPEQTVRLADPAGLVVLTSATVREDPARIGKLMQALQPGPAPLAGLARQLGGAGDDVAAVRAVSPLLVKLLNYGVIELL